MVGISKFHKSPGVIFVVASGSGTLKQEGPWWDKWRSLKAYYDDNQTLAGCPVVAHGRWISDARKQWKAGNLEPEQIKVLKEIGVVLNAPVRPSGRSLSGNRLERTLELREKFKGVSRALDVPEEDRAAFKEYKANMSQYTAQRRNGNLSDKTAAQLDLDDI